jgi:P pilus assembly chaperone PapD
MLFRVFTVALILTAAMLPAVGLAQEPAVPVNPTRVEFDCVDHDRDTQHELKILQTNGTNRVLITTILLGDPAKEPDGKVRTTINVQPIAFGEYVARVNAIAVSSTGATLRSADSEESNVFIRAPGGPGRPTVR